MLELEDAGEDERKELHGKIESLESIVRMLELKSKNSSDHGIVPVVAVYAVSVLSLGHLCVCGGGVCVCMCFAFKLYITSELVKNYNMYVHVFN